jgi:hypothetical protein
VDQAVSREVLKAIQPLAIDAALEAADQVQRRQDEATRALQLELEQARYEARLAARRYEAIDPDNRLVAAELESRWNMALLRVRELENRASQAEQKSASAPVVNRDDLLALAEDLPSVWESPSSDPSLKQKIIRILTEEIVADVDDSAQEVVLVIHWIGGRHSELRVAKLKTGEHSRCTKPEAVDILRQMSGRYTDEQIARTLNRLRLKTGAGNTWSEARVRSSREHLKLPAYRNGPPEDRVNMLQAAQRLGVSTTLVRRLIGDKILPATQIVPGAPWEIDSQAVVSPVVIQAAAAAKNRDSRQQSPISEGTLVLPGLDEESVEGEDFL